MSRPPFAETIRRRLVVFDGAMGTELYRRHQFVNKCFEHLCLTDPGLVRQIHQENRDAGADVLTTNSFAATRFKLAGFLLADHLYAINRAAAAIARDVAGDVLYVAGSVGPLGVPLAGVGPVEGVGEAEAVDAFAEAMTGLRDGGADFILLETFSKRQELICGMRAAARLGIACIPSMTFAETGATRSGESVDEFYAPFPPDLPPPLALGFNCGVGPKEMLDILENFIPRAPYPVLVQPNAGTPRTVSDRTIYMSTPEYLATYAGHFAHLGVRCIGGCCGHGPEHIHALAQGVKAIHKDFISLRSTKGAQEAAPLPETPLPRRSALAAKMQKGEFITTVEIVPPLGWDLSSTLAKCAACQAAGVDVINIPDGPRASSRVSPLVTALRIQNEVGIEAVLHLTARDRNVIGLQADLLGCAAAGVNNLLIITGDPPKLGDYPFATAVFDIDSIGLTRIASRLNVGLDIGGARVDPPTRFFIGVGADPSHLDQQRELDRLAQKVDTGAHYVITQPIWEPDVLLRFIERVRPLGAPVVAGVWPLISHRNALFLNNEVPGISIPDTVMRRMAAADSREAARAEGVAIAREFLAAVRGHLGGVQVSTPLGNVQVALEVLQT